MRLPLLLLLLLGGCFSGSFLAEVGKFANSLNPWSPTYTPLFMDKAPDDMPPTRFPLPASPMPFPHHHFSVSWANWGQFHRMLVMLTRGQQYYTFWASMFDLYLPILSILYRDELAKRHEYFLPMLYGGVSWRSAIFFFFPLNQGFNPSSPIELEGYWPLEAFAGHSIIELHGAHAMGLFFDQEKFTFYGVNDQSYSDIADRSTWSKRNLHLYDLAQRLAADMYKLKGQKMENNVTVTFLQIAPRGGGRQMERMLRLLFTIERNMQFGSEFMFRGAYEKELMDVNVHEYVELVAGRICTALADRVVTLRRHSDYSRLTDINWTVYEREFFNQTCRIFKDDPDYPFKQYMERFQEGIYRQDDPTIDLR